MISKKQITVFWGKKWDAIVPTLRFEIWTLPLCWYTLIIFTVYIWKDRHKYWVRIEIDLKFIHTVLYQNELWHGNDCMIFHICKEDRPIIYMHDETTGIYPRTTVFILSV
jgi:hypothetical protein